MEDAGYICPMDKIEMEEEVNIKIIDINVSDGNSPNTKYVSVMESDEGDAVLTEIENKALEQYFEKVDAVDGKKDGKIEIDKIVKIIRGFEATEHLTHLGRQIKKRMSNSEIKETMKDVDLDKDGFISLSEFKEYSRKIKQKKYKQSTSREEGVMKYFRIIAHAKVVVKWPPPFFIPIISLIQLIMFIIQRSHYGNSWYHPLMFCSQERTEVWRYLTYCLVHSDYEHIIANLTLQLVVGIPLEMEHKAFSVSCIYFIGVFCGSLGVYCFDPAPGLMGASGGVYSLIAAHLSTMVLNWVEDRAVLYPRVRSEKKAAHATDGKLFRILKLVAVILFGVIDTGYSLYRRHSEEGSQVSYVAHFIGTLTGLLVGLIVLKDRNEEPWERHLKAGSFLIFSLLFIIGVFWNILVSPPTL